MDTYIGKNALPEILRYCREHNYTRFVLVTDQNEYPAYGAAVEAGLKGQGAQVQTILLQGNPVTADDRYIVQILAPLDDSPRVFLSVASGTITDMTRFVSYRVKSPFISIPTAPSMDGYASNGSSLTLGGLKQTVYSRPPEAIFADLDVLSHAPKPMVSAGLGDTFGKFTALADWKLGALLWGDAYREDLAGQVQRSLMACVELSRDLEGRWEENIAALTGALIEVGRCMLLMGNSRPAAGSEHSLSHYWEMKFARQGRPASFHGVKVAYASILVAARFELLRTISRDEAARRMAATPAPQVDVEVQDIRRIYGPLADHLIRLQQPFLDLDEAGYARLRQLVMDKWDEVQAIAASVPPAEEIRRLLRQANLPTEPEQIHLTEEDIREAIQYGHFIRTQFSVMKLSRLLGINDRGL